MLFTFINSIFLGTSQVLPISHLGALDETLLLRFLHKANGLDSFLSVFFLDSQGLGHDAPRTTILYSHVTLQVNYSSILFATGECNLSTTSVRLTHYREEEESVTTHKGS